MTILSLIPSPLRFRQNVTQLILSCWYKKNFISYLLYPLALVFQLITKLRFWWFIHIKGQAHLTVPLIVVGNITVGGTGKTPLVIWLIERLRQEGFHPGVVSRGYGRKVKNKAPVIVAGQDSAQVGDEPLLIAQKTGCPIVVSHYRVQAARFLLQHFPQVDIIISDDGLQHYALGRDVEIAVLDGVRRLGNGLCLPAGPLRESSARLKSVDFVICNGAAQTAEWEMKPSLGEDIYQVANPRCCRKLQHFHSQKVHAIAGIGHPERFFTLLRAQGIELIEHPFEDHHSFSLADVTFEDGLPVLMTEKDAVKCAAFCRPNVWAVPLVVKLSSDFIPELLRRLKSGQKAVRHSGLPNLQAAAPLQKRK